MRCLIQARTPECRPVNAVLWFHVVDIARLVLAPALTLCVLVLSRPRAFGIRCVLGILVGWAAFVAFTLSVYNPAGIAAGHALGHDFPESRYDNNTMGIALLFGWWLPALALCVYAVARAYWRQSNKRVVEKTGDRP
jgi:hypothetical protein